MGTVGLQKECNLSLDNLNKLKKVKMNHYAGSDVRLEDTDAVVHIDQIEKFLNHLQKLLGK